MEKKYELTNNTIEINGHILYRIIALKDINLNIRYYPGNARKTTTSFLIKSGEFGGYVESEENLSHTGDCWILPLSSVYGNSKVIEDAIVNNCCLISNSLIAGTSNVYKTTPFNEDLIITDSIILGDTILSCSRFISSVAINFYRKDDEIYRNDRCYYDTSLDDFEKVILWKNGLLERNMSLQKILR